MNPVRIHCNHCEFIADFSVFIGHSLRIPAVRIHCRGLLYRWYFFKNSGHFRGLAGSRLNVSVCLSVRAQDFRAARASAASIFFDELAIDRAEREIAAKRLHRSAQAQVSLTH